MKFALPVVATITLTAPTATSCVLLCCLFAATARADDARDPANPNVSAQARAILKYFQSLEGQTDKCIVSGQFADFGERTNLRIMNQIRRNTGHWPALLGVDYLNKEGLEFEAPNAAAIEYWKAGGLVTVSAHLYNPANAEGGGLRDKGVDLATLLTPGTDTHDRWMRELDYVADGLQQLRKAGVVVLWRPFHEMGGDWFWWGGHEPDAFIKLWRHMFDYFTVTKKLDNLLWVYSPNHGEKTAAYYPGDRYVDLVGLDAYTDFVDPEHIKGYDELARLPKPLGFTEFGPHGAQDPPGDYDYPQFLDGVRKNFPRTVFFMSWNWNWSLARNKNVKQLLDRPEIVNREDLPKDLAGTSAEH